MEVVPMLNIVNIINIDSILILATDLWIYIFIIQSYFHLSLHLDDITTFHILYENRQKWPFLSVFVYEYNLTYISLYSFIAK